MAWIIKGVVTLVSLFVFASLIIPFLKSKKKLGQTANRLRLLRGRTDLTFTVLEEKNGLDFEDFSEGSMIHTAEEKSSIDKSIFPSRTVKVNSVRSLITGFVANVADTLGIGSFAVIVAFNNRWKLIDDKQLPGTLNAHSVLPTLIQSLLFLNVVEIDLFLLVSFVSAACVGGLISSYLVARLDRQTIRFVMSLGFFGIGLLILTNQLKLLPIGGEALSLPPAKLGIGIAGMLLIGMLPAIGAGFYVPIQVLLFFLGLSPLAAFPIMTTTGAIVQSLTAYSFIRKKEVASGESLLMAISGIVGVILAVKLITFVNFTFLRWLLLAIVFYNGAAMWTHYRRELKVQSL